jgi:hypothetical protein
LNKSSLHLILLAVVPLFGLALAGPASGQKAPGASVSGGAQKYDLAREITVEGTVTSVITSPAAGMLAGAHALVATSSGTVDAHLGIYALRGAGALALSAGDHVRMVGLMTSVKGQPVLLVRTIQTARGFITIRNAHGILLRSAASTATRPQQESTGGRS